MTKSELCNNIHITIVTMGGVANLFPSWFHPCQLSGNKTHLIHFNYRNGYLIISEPNSVVHETKIKGVVNKRFALWMVVGCAEHLQADHNDQYYSDSHPLPVKIVPLVAANRELHQKPISINETIIK